MRITLLTMGSRGDVQPYLALGVGLKRAGHTVRLASHGIFEPWIQGFGLDFALVRFNPRDIVHHPQAQRARSNILRFMLTVRRIIGPQFLAVLDDLWKASQGAEAIIASPTAFNALDCARELGVPLIVGLLQPLIPTRAFPSFFAPPWPYWGPAFNRLTHFLFEQVLWQSVRTYVNQWRRARLGSPPREFLGPYASMRAARVPHLLAYSAALLPKPSDWDEWHHVTGYWFLELPSGFRPPTEVEDFIQAGAPPVYIGFGSMRDEGPERLTRVVLEALARSNQRGLLATGWGALSHVNLPDTIMGIGDIPHQWLFPRMAALVHHGGAGTTAAGLYAGVPSIVVPFGGDQHHWARILCRMGVSPPALPANRLTADSLSNAIAIALNDDGLRARISRLATALQSEDGVSNAVEIVQRYLASTGG